MGLSSVRAFERASGPQGYQSTGLPACCWRYGDASPARRFRASCGIYPLLVRTEPGRKHPRSAGTRFVADGSVGTRAASVLELDSAGERALERLDEVEHHRVRPVARAVEASANDPFWIDDPGFRIERGAELVAHDRGLGVEKNRKRGLRLAKE